MTQKLSNYSISLTKNRLHYIITVHDNRTVSQVKGPHIIRHESVPQITIDCALFETAGRNCLLSSMAAPIWLKYSCILPNLENFAALLSLQISTSDTRLQRKNAVVSDTYRPETREYRGARPKILLLQQQQCRIEYTA